MNKIETAVDESPTEYPNIYTAIPPNGQVCPHTGLKHTHLYMLLAPGGGARPHVRVAQLRKPGTRRGKTLFHVGDFFRYLERVASQPAGENGLGAPRKND